MAYSLLFLLFLRWQLAIQAVYLTNQRQAHTREEERDLFLKKTNPIKHSSLEPKKWPHPLNPSKKRSKKSVDQVEHNPTQLEAAKICIYATRAKKTVCFGKTIYKRSRATKAFQRHSSILFTLLKLQYSIPLDDISKHLAFSHN